MTESSTSSDAGTEIFGSQNVGARVRPTDLELRTTEPQAAPVARGGLLHAVNRWRLSRPFWGSLILAIGGYQVMAPMLGASLQMVAGAGIRAANPLIIGGLMVLCAVLALFIPSNRFFLGITGMVLSIASLPFANLGGWLIGLVLGIVGSGLIFAWAPFSDKQLAEFAGRARRKQERRNQRDSRRTAGHAQ